MSLLPIVFRDMMAMARPLRMLENHMRMTEELLQPFVTPMGVVHRRPAMEYSEEPEKVIHDKQKFEVKLDVKNFAPQEITVKIVDANEVQVEAKHEEDRGNEGFISRHMIRRFVVPNGHDLKDVVSSLSSDGVLTVTAPRTVDPSVQQERIVKIEHTGPEREPEKKKIEESA